MKSIGTFLRVFSTLSISLAFMGFAQAALMMPSENLMRTVYSDSIDLLLKNLSRNDVSPGAVIASPSRSSPDYFYHWTRDAALTHEGLFSLYEYTDDVNLKERILNLAKDWIAFEIKTQSHAEYAEGGLGEPRFHVNGEVNTAEWGRPQNDGPAARAITMSLWALKFLDEGEGTYVRDTLYHPLPAKTPIKMDLEYVAKHWREASVDLWEEVRGLHFYTLAMQRRSLILGAHLANRLNDVEGALYYSTEANKIKTALDRFLNAGKPYIVATLDQTGGWGHKQSGLDIAIIIAANHALFEDEFFLSKKFMFTNTLAVLEERFDNIYSINRDASLATAMGRYPEDVYDGVGFSGANPWFLATHASAEYYCKLAHLERSPELAASLKEKGLSFLARTLKHRDQNTGEMSEQFSRYDGFLVGASHLTWSYASYIAAYQACH
ncbi:MAG: glycoside hydrolase family 15 protein [Bdellovibrionota bacterium]